MYSKLIQDIREKAIQSGRNPQEITLIAVTKTHPWERVLPVYEAGCRQFGENRVQEALPKIEQAPSDSRWHLIGTLQKNKVRKVIGQFSLIHSVDSFDLAEKIASVSKELGVTTHILLQANTSMEETKHGFTIDEWRPYIPKILALPALSVDGLMTIGPNSDDKDKIRMSFTALRHFRDEIQAEYHVKLPHLSMGMSQDYPIAIEEGATLLRIGTLIFGERRGC